MASGASIVVDIKAQITGYQEQIEKIRQELKKVDPGSSIGKSLTKTLVQAEQKLNQLSRNAEKRVTSQGQLDHLFDQLHQVNDLMRSLGQGMSNVGLDDVLLTASDHARELGTELKQLKTDMTQKGANFLDDLKKTNPKELQAVFDQLKFNPSKMGIEEFVEKFDIASKEVKEKINDITKQQEEAQKEADRAMQAAQLRAQLPGNLQTSGKVTQKFLSADLKSTKFVSESQQQANIAAQNFLDQIRTGLEKDARDDKTTDKLNTIIASTADKLTRAKSESDVEQALTALDRVITANTATDTTGTKNIASLTGGLDISKWVEQLTGKAQADQEFITRVQAIADILSKNESTATAGTTISEKLNTLINPSDIGTFESNMKQLIKAMSDGLTQFNQETAKLDTEGKQKLAESLGQELNVLKGEAAQLEIVKTNPQYAQFRGEIDGILNRVQHIEQAIGLETSKSREDTALGVQSTGKGLLNELPKANQEATDSLKQYGSMLEDVQARQQMVGKVEGIAQRWFSVYAAVRMVSKAFRSMTENIKNLDKTITEIAIVTDMSQGDLWQQMPDYTKIARKYGASLQGVYEVSQLYYQQGLGQEDVMALTEETLKMARISGLDYSEATNYMTNAVRSFKIEMQDASRVVDVYSALAATSASSTSELATAMSKTASSAAAVGSSFEATSAMMAVMIETTRESPENIGSALKSIISRYGELKENKTGIDEEGEEYSLNKVDTALQSVGISIHDAKGEFRDFDEVIMELADSWDTIDTNTQRYIATVMAGNRQQSRFLALVSNGERLREETDIAENSEDAATLQMLKTMDSIDYKSQQLQTSLQSLYTSTGVENLFKGILDGANQIVETFTQMPTIFQLPIPAIMSLATNFISVANLVMTTLRIMKQKFIAQWSIDDEVNLARKQANANREVEIEREKDERINENHQAAQQRKQATDQQTSRMKTGSKLALGAQLFGTGMNLAAGLISDKGTDNRRHKAELGIGGSALQYGALGFQLSGSPLGAAIGATAGAIMGAWQNFSYIFETTAQQAKRLAEEAQEEAQQAQVKQSKAKTTEKTIADLKKLSSERYKDAEAQQKYIEAANKAAEEMPNLVDHFDSEGNAILNLANAYQVLSEARKDATESAQKAAISAGNAAQKATQEAKEKYDQAVAREWIDSGTLKDESTMKRIREAGINSTYMRGEENFNLNSIITSILNGRPNQSGDQVAQTLQNINDSSTGLFALMENIINGNFDEIYNQLENNKEAVISDWQSDLDALEVDEDTKVLLNWIMDDVLTSYGEIKQLEGDWLKSSSKEQATRKREISSLVKQQFSQIQINANYGTGTIQADAELLQKRIEVLSDANGMVTDRLMHQWEKIADGKEGAELEKAWETFINSIGKGGSDDPLTVVYESLKSIPEDSLEALNDLYEQRGNLTKEQYKARLKKIIPQQDNEFYESQMEYYESAFKGWDETLALEKWQNYKFKPSFSNKGFGPEEQRAILNQYESLNKLYDQGGITESNANIVSENYRKLLITSKSLNDAEKDQVQNLLTNMDLSSEGIQAALDSLEQNDEIVTHKDWIKATLETMLLALPENLNTAIESYLDSYAESTENLSKDLSKVTSGMSQKDAQDLASRLDIDTSTKYFTAKEGKLFLNDINLLYEYYFGENGSLANLRKQAEIQQEELSEISPKDAFKEGQTFKHISTNELKTLNKAWEQWKETEQNENWEEFLSNYYTRRIDDVQELSQDLMSSMLLENAIKEGKLRDIIDAAASGDARQVIDGITGQLQEALKTGDFLWLIKNSNLSNEFKSKLPELKQTYDDAQSSVIDDMINGLDEGFSYIEGTEFNKELLSDLKSKGLAELTPAVNGVSNAIIKASRDQVLTYLEGITDASQVGMTTSELREKIASLRADKYEKSNMGTLQTILDNYDNIDEVAYQNLLDHWDFADISAIFTRRADGSYKANLPKLVESYRNGNIKLDELTQEKMNEVVTKAIDDGMSSITSAADYTTKGTTKFQDMVDFTKAFNEAIPGINAEITDLFSYDKDLQGYTLDTTSYRTYLEAQKQLLISLGEDTEYIDGIIENANKSIIDAIDVKSFMEAEQKGTKEAPSKARETLIKQLKNANIWESGVVERSEDWRDYYDNLVIGTQYVKFDPTAEAKRIAQNAKKTNDQVREAAANNFIEQIEKGGSSAVMALHALAIVQDKELTSEEIESAYLSQVQQLEEAFDQLEYGIGSIVNGEAVTALENAGYHLTQLGGGNAVIDSIGDISKAYENYYNALKETNVATVAALNEAYAKVLETKDGKAAEQNAIEALGDASGMTYTTLGAILSDAGMSLEDNLENLSDIIESTGGNKIRIKDFAAFARRMNWDYDSEEYTSAFKSYNDSLIERNKQVEKSVNEEIQGLSDIKPGDWLNLTQTEKALKKAGKDNSKKIQEYSQNLYTAQQNNEYGAVQHWQHVIDELYSEDTLAKLNKSLLQYGATLSDGILRLADDANLIGIAQTLQTAVSDAGIDIADDVKDMIQNIMDAYSDLIIKGIEGSLTNIEKSDLKKKASDIGVDLSDNDFVQGAEGFELSMNKSIALWSKWGQINNQQQKKIYKTLTQQLKDNNSNYKTTTKMLSHLIDMQDELNELKDHETNKNKGHIEQLENEIKLLKEMQMYSLTHEDSSWNFMSNDAIPDSIDNALNYFANWKTLESQLNTWAGSNVSELDGFAAGLKHIQEVADATGGQFTYMGKEITAGGDAYGEFLDHISEIRTWDDKSKSWALSNKALKEILDFDMSLGGKGISKGLRDNVDEYVQYNANLLKEFDEFTGGLAEVYKSLNDYSDANNGHTFEDFIKTATDDMGNAFNYFDYDQFTAQINKNNKVWKSFQQFTNKVTINGTKWDEAMKGGAKNFKEGSDNYKALMGVMKMALSENWDLESDYQAIADQLSQSGFNGEVTLGDIVITAIDGATIIKKKKNGKDVFIDPDGNEYTNINDAKDAINRKAIEQYQKELGQYSRSDSDNGYSIEIAGKKITYVIKNGQIEVVNENGEYVVTGDSVTDVNTQLQSYYANQNSDIGRVAKSVSEEAWSSYISPQYKNAKTYNETGHITAEARQKGQAAGLTSIQGVTDAYNAAVKAVGDKNETVINEANIQEFNEAVAAEFYASTGIKLDPNQIKVTMDEGMADHIAAEMNMTQTAVDVMNGITQAFTGTSGQQISEVLSSAIAGAFTQKEIPISEIKVSPQLVSVDGDSVTVAEIPSGTGTITNLKVKATTVEADGTISAAEITAELDGQTISVKIDKNGAQGDIDAIKKAIQALSPQKVTVEIPAPSTSPITDAINGLGVQTVDVKLNPIIGGIFGMLFGGGTATGNIGLANAKGTLMGELGPELVVSGGRYFVVGQSGPEMVDLADDAIVFNHLQTKSLLEKGSSSTRGRAITNERNAVAYATGSIHGGHAMPGGGNIVDVNNKYRGAGSVWEAGFNAANTTKKSDDDKALKSFLKELERWYNWLQKIAYLEKEISYQEALRSKYQSDFTRTGAEYYDSQIKTLGLLKDQIVIQKDLVKEQKKFLEQRKAELANSPLSTVYTFDEKGQLVYQEGMYENFSKLFGTNDQGIPYYTAEEQYEALKAMGMEEFMKYDNSGQEIDQKKDGWQATAVQAFADKMEKERDEMQKLIDDTLDGETKLLELQTNQNQILQDIEDNQISVEQKVLKAIEDSRQREIDELQKERDAIEKGNQKLIEGLNQQLQKEQDLYNRQQDADELSKLQRQLAIAQRSGGSAATIADLQRQITEKQKDIYFETQQAEIDALQEASDNEIERLDNQIQLMEETLAYEKEHGLLWQEVRSILSQDAESIMAFIKGNTTEYWGKSTAELQKVIRQDLFEVDRFKKFQEDTTNGIQDLVNKFVTNDSEKKEPESVAPTEQTPAANTGESTGGSGGGSGGRTSGKSTDTKTQYEVMGQTFDTKKEAEEYLKKVREDTHGAHGMTSEIKEVEVKKEASEKATTTVETPSASAPENTGTDNVTKHENSAGNTYYTYTDPDTGKTITGNAWYMKSKGVPGFAFGGLNNYTGLAVLHGTKDKPEAVLNASQTKVLRDNILSNRPDSLINLLKSYNEAYHGLSKATYDSISNNSTNTTTIGRAEVNLHIDKLANDYDSKRAANTIMDEMLRIASKTSANNSVRR